MFQRFIDSWRRLPIYWLTMSDFTTHSVLWAPDAKTRDEARITAFIEWLQRDHGRAFDGYHDLWSWSIGDLDGFWNAVKDYFRVSFSTPAQGPSRIDTMPGAAWFPGAHLNYAEHVMRGTAEGPAIIAVHEDGAAEHWQWSRLRAEVAAFASYLRTEGVGRGDRVVAFLPNIAEAVVAFLASASIGAVFAICGPEFGAASVVARFQPLEPTVLITSTGYRFAGRRHDKTDAITAIRGALPSLRRVVGVGANPPVPDSIPWAEAVATKPDNVIDQVPFDHPLWVLFSSGTTGAPKGIVHGHGGILLEHLKYLGLHVDMRSTDRFFWYTSTSWMVWTVVVSGLLTGATVVLYDGSPTHPSPSALWRIVADQRVSIFGASAAYLHTCAKHDLVPRRDLDISALRSLNSTGSPLSPHGYRWAYENVGADVPLFSGSGGTDVASAFAAGNPLVPVRVGEIPAPCLGVDLQAWDDVGRPVVGEVGELVVTKPMPSMPLYFWNDPDGTRYRSSYFDTFPGVWRHGDWVEITAEHGVIIHGRSDATLNRMGVRIGTAEIYQAVENLDEVAEALAVGVDEDDGGYWLPLFVVLKPGLTLDADLADLINKTIREQASPRHVPDEIIGVPGIPHTLTGKKLEVPIKRMMLGLPAAVDPEAIDQPALLDLFAHVRDSSARRTAEASRWRTLTP